MIKMLRIDFRLIHGQTGVFWTSHLHPDCIFVVSDTLLDDPVKLATVKLSKPVGVKLVIKNVEAAIQAINSGVTDKYKMLILTEDVEYAFRLMRGCKIQSVNLGGMMPSDERNIRLNEAFFVSETELESIKQMVRDGYYLYLRPLPVDPKVDVKAIISNK